MASSEYESSGSGSTDLDESDQSDALLLAPLRALIHSGRLLGYAPYLIYSMIRHPKNTLLGASTYYSVRRLDAWQSLMRWVLKKGSSKQPRYIRAQSKPYDPNRQYLLAAHPHGILNYGWWNLFCRFGLNFVDGVQLIMCVAPLVKFYPLYGEIFNDRVTDASRETIEAILKGTHPAAKRLAAATDGQPLTPAIIPGGFSEATYTGADPNVEYAYCADRMGFIKLAIEAQVDILVAYSYGLNDMYKTLAWQRHWRAVKAQAWGLPTVLWTGPYLLGNTPFTEQITVVTFDPFPASRYTVDQLPQAHADYMAYLKQCFDSKKAECGHAHKRLEFIGKSKPPEAMAAAARAPRSKL